jgi:hypothetical protein
MNVVNGLSATPIGRALIACFFDLPRWALLNIAFAVSLLPVFWALLDGITVGITEWWVILLTFPVVIVTSGMVNMAARTAEEATPRLQDVFTYPATYTTAVMIWAGVVIALLLFMIELPVVLLFVVSALVLALLLIGVFALFIPSLLKVKGWLIWRNALVLTVHYPMVALGLLALLGVGAWGVWISRGTLVVLVPALWMMIAAHSVEDRISAVQSATQPH